MNHQEKFNELDLIHLEIGFDALCNEAKQLDPTWVRDLEGPIRYLIEKVSHSIQANNNTGTQVDFGKLIRLVKKFRDELDTKARETNK